MNTLLLILALAELVALALVAILVLRLRAQVAAVTPNSELLQGGLQRLEVSFRDELSRQKIEVKFVCGKCKAASCFFAYPAGEQKLEYVGPDEKKHKVKEDDMRTVLKILLSGSTQQQYSIMQARESNKVPKSTFYTIQKVICSVIVRVTEDALEEERQSMRREFESGSRTEWQAATQDLQPVHESRSTSKAYCSPGFGAVRGMSWELRVEC